MSKGDKSRGEKAEQFLSEIIGFEGHVHSEEEPFRYDYDYYGDPINPLCRFCDQYEEQGHLPDCVWKNAKNFLEGKDDG